MHNQSGTSICEKCGPGKYSYGATAECSDCPVGRYNNSDNTGCSPCPAGKWSDKISASNASVCTDCIAGTYNQVIGAGTLNNCLQCPKGRASSTVGAPSLTSCIKCPVNSFSNTNGATSCSACATLGAGMMNEEIGSAICHGCPSGLYLNQTSLTCDKCALGSFSVYGSTECTSCEAGKFSNFNQTMCIDCEKGKWSDSVSASSSSTCQTCPAGTYNNGIGGKDRSHCNKCPSGKSSNKIGATSLSDCIDCQQQYYTDEDGMASCKKCPALKTTFKNGSSECFFCAEGKYLTGKTCSQCSPGKWSDGSFPTCRSCVKGTYNNTDNTACVACSPGRYSETFEADAASTCILCDRGKFGAATGANRRELCTDCPLGRAHNSTGKTNLLDCLNCGVGFYAPNDGMTSCFKCERLKQNTAVGSTSCDYCPAGEYIDENALPAPRCKKCTPGFYSYSGSDKCTMCEAGKYSDRQINCVACRPGYYSNATAASNISTCVACPKGKFNSMDGSSSIESCTSCPAGRVLDIVAAVSLHQCIRCDIGKYTTTPGQIECRECPPRQTNTMVGSSTCEYCDGGKFLNGTVVCTDCEHGRYSKKGDETCSACLPGFFSSAGQTECEACDRGKSNNIFAASQCNECRKGTFQDVRGKTDCEDCPVDSYNPKKGIKFQEHCTRCAARRTTNGTKGSINSTACMCRKGYLVEYNKPGHCPSDTLESGCFTCPPGGKCSTVALSIENLHSKCGYWRRNATSCKFYQCGDHASNDCNVTSRCVGGVFGGSQIAGHNLKERDQCRQNHTGPLCGACIENHRLWDDGYCHECVQPPANMFQYVMYAFLIIFLGIIAIQLEVSAFYFFGFTSTRHVAIKNRRQTCWEHFLDARERGEWVRIMMNYFQIVSYIDIVFEIRWPNDFAWVPRYMRMFSSFDVTSWIHTFNWCLKFLGSVRYHSFIVTSMLFFVIVVVQVLKHFCKGLKPKSNLQEALDRKHKVAKKKKKKKKINPEILDEDDRAARDFDEDDDEEDEELSCLELNMKYIKSHYGNIQKHYATFAKSSFYVFSLMHCGLVARSFQVYRCDVELEPYERYLNADYAVSCHDPYTEWGSSAVLATVMLFTIGLGIPLYLAFRLRAYDMYIRSIIVTNDDIEAASIPNIRNFGKKKASQITLRETLAELEFELRLKMAEKSAKYYYLVSNIYSLYREGFYWWELVEIVRSAIMTGCLILLRPGSFLQHVLGTLLLLVHLALVTVIKPYRNAYDNNVQFILSAVLVVTLPATAAVHRAKDTEERDGMLNYIIFLNVVVFAFAFILRARQDMQLKEKDMPKNKVYPDKPPPPPRGLRPEFDKKPLPPIPKVKKGTAKNFDINDDNSDSEDETKSENASSEDQKIDISPTPPTKISLKPLRPEGNNRNRPPPSFKGLQRLNTMHRKKITRQMSELNKLDLDGDGELEKDEVVDAYVKNGYTQEEAEAKVNNLIKKYDIDGDGTISLREALNTEVAGAMEEEERVIEEQMHQQENIKRKEHRNHTMERLKKRNQKGGRKKSKKDESRSKSPKKDGRPLPTKTVRGSNQSAERNERIKEAYENRMMKKSMKGDEEDTDSTSSAEDF